AVTGPADPLPLPAGPLRVALRGARVRYHPAQPFALDGIDLDLWAGRRVALIGPSGAGKSTVAGLLLRFCELSGGTATLGGADLARYRADDVRTVIGGGPPRAPPLENPGREDIPDAPAPGEDPGAAGAGGGGGRVAGARGVAGRGAGDPA